ncbi:MAG: D-2-hydroxyacid dehydrogenase [Rhodospirillales bacterium]|nr:D-2-hydroxyacid dehydrogenase [Rhodospirillales bacterium]MBT4040875.1 D-2-hydroxyacid dehydrogenase [Rhodospirillales bacterium]MBT4628152.1 D-2-hydroxyacid dehydrogenase [Rhodospirillales bacterium]MBT5351964.1 D-2-hydroxyacid dehydrogenase [Rhodospirillales bacterium]MBT5521123.1 D-2-hydroxyacid dehydrogenase [Rhodospirillales bacterium]
MSHRVVFLDRDTVAPDVTVRRPDFDHEWEEFGKTSADQVLERLKGATIAITNKVPLREDVLKQLPDLKMIAVAATGTDVIDLAYCKDNGIIVSNIRGYAVNTVPEHTFALILSLSRSIGGYREDVANGEWQKSGQFCFFTHPISDLSGKKLAIMGEGALGQSVANIARAFGMIPLFAAHKGSTGLGPLYTPWDEIIETADIFTLHCPLLPSTRGMIGLDEFKRMKNSAIIVNTARGGLIVEEDLVTAMEQGMIRGAAIDVISTEPPADDHPFFKLLEKPNFILTPHVAWASTEAIQTLVDQMIDNVENFVAGSPSNVVGDF